MQFNTITKQKLPFFVALGLMAVLTSCGSFQYAGYDNDGIYTSDSNDPEVKQEVVTTSSSNSNYYKNYFAENSAEVEAIKEESEIFTDIDSYEGNYVEQAQDTLEQRPSYGGWGQNSTVTINVIDNGWYGFNDPWLWNGGFGWNNWGWNNWRWNRGWGWNAGWGLGWNNWGWNAGWNNWGWNAWCPPGFYNNGFNNGYYRNSNRLAYAGSRRGSILNNSRLSRNRRGTSALSRQDYSTRRLSNATRATRSTRNTRAVRSSNPSRSIGNSRTTRSVRRSTPTRATRSSSPRATRSVRSSSPSRSTRASSPSRSTRSSSSVRSSRSSRSSGSIRSSSSRSSRSSGSRSSSRRGRG